MAHLLLFKMGYLQDRLSESTIYPGITGLTSALLVQIPNKLLQAYPMAKMTLTLRSHLLLVHGRYVGKKQPVKLEYLCVCATSIYIVITMMKW